MKLTREIIMAARTTRGAWNRHQLELIGVAWPPQKGWIDRVIGADISDSDLAKFKTLATLKKRERRLGGTPIFDAFLTPC